MKTLQSKHRASSGLKGGWSTAVLKEYPPALNGGLAAGFLDAIGQCSYDSKLTVPISFSERYDSMMWIDYGRHRARLCRLNLQKNQDFS